MAKKNKTEEHEDPIDSSQEGQEDKVSSENGLSEYEKCKEDYDALNEKFLRLFAEFENFRKRNTKERLELIKTAAQDTIKDLLPVLDDFDRAKKSADDEQTEEVFSEGVELVYQKLYKVLEQKGLKEMESTGLDFDAELHEAVTEIAAPSEDMKGKIIDTIEKGYFLKDKIIRHAKVVVGK